MPIYISLEVVSSVSAFASVMVVVTVLASSAMRQKIFNQIILFISVCDYFGATATFFGNPPENEALCFAQGFFVNFFFSAVLGYITILSFALYNVVRYNKIPMRRRYMHLIVWSVCSLKSIFPLTTLKYGWNGNTIWCNIAYPGSRSPFLWTFYFWNILNYLVYVAVCLGLIMYWGVSIRMMISSEGLIRSKTVSIVLDALYIYPLTVVACYGILLITDLVYICGGNPSPHFYVLGEACIAIHGFCVACVFFRKSREARMFWLNMLCPQSFLDSMIRSQQSATQSADSSTKGGGAGAGGLNVTTSFEIDGRSRASLGEVVSSGQDVGRSDSTDSQKFDQSLSEESFLKDIVHAHDVIHL